MKLYHGSNLEFCEIDLAKGLPAKDFGRGFYATSSLECAEKTARQRVVRLGGVPIANDKLSLLFRLYEKDLITVDEFAQRMKFKELYTQYSFHTERAVKLLRFKEVLNVK